jgi:hypothetical protein
LFHFGFHWGFFLPPPPNQFLDIRDLEHFFSEFTVEKHDSPKLPLIGENFVKELYKKTCRKHAPKLKTVSKSAFLFLANFCHLADKKIQCDS